MSSSPLEIDIKSWEHFEKTVSDIIEQPLSRSWAFRGQSSQTESLKPSILRILQNKEISRKAANELEAEATRKFISQAHMYLSEYVCHYSEHLLDWWGLMQHYGAPTRLLDWTLSPYVAVYFACIGDLIDDGEVWVFNDYRLREYIKEAFGLKDDVSSGKFTKMCQGADEPSMLLSVERNTKIDRMISQQGIFTFSTNILEPHSTILGEYFKNIKVVNGYLKLKIPSYLKIGFLEKLYLMNITASSLFHGVDGLGRSIDEFMKISLRKIEYERAFVKILREKISPGMGAESKDIN